MYDDRPSPLLSVFTLIAAWAAVALLAPVLADFWHMDVPTAPILTALAAFATAAAMWPWLYLLLPPAAAALLYWFPAIREGLWLDYTVWYTDLRLGLWPGPYGLIAWGALGLTLMAFAFLFVREPVRRGTGHWSFLAGTLAFGHMWLWGSDTALTQYGFFLLAILPLWAAGTLLHRERRWYKAGRRVVQSTAWLAPSVAGVALAALAAWAVPVPTHGVELGPVTAWLRATFPGIERMRGGATADEDQIPQGFSIATAGFARRVSELGGPVKPDTAPALTVAFPKGGPEDPLYLRGTAMTNYNGRGWATETRPGDVGMDSPPTGSELAVNIALKGLNNTTLFYPRELSSLRGVDFRFGREGHIFATQALPGAYQVEAYLPGGRPTGFQPPTYDPGRYIALPKSLPPRVAELTKRITKDAATPYDAALAVETYLRTFPYALDVPATPPGRDFVDYYLFDLQRGYCTYSSTAMAVMLRTIGISTRWVQGFVVEPGPVETEVAFSNAHAWVEAYFPGYGWATFDPTPRFALPTRLGPATQGESRTAPVVEPPAPRQPVAPALTAKPERRPVPWLWIAGAVAALAYVATSFRRFFRERIDWTDERAGLLRAFAMLTGALRRMGLGRRPSQTPLEYARTVGDNWPDLAPYVRDAAADATAARFARPGAPAPEGARRRMSEALAAVWRQAERRWGVTRTAWIRFRFFWGKD